MMNTRDLVKDTRVLILVVILLFSIFLFLIFGPEKVELFGPFKPAYYKKTDPVNYKTFHLTGNQSAGQINLFPDEEVPGVEQKYFVKLNLPNIRGGDYSDTGLQVYHIYASETLDGDLEMIGVATREGNGFYTAVLPATKKFQKFAVSAPGASPSEEIKNIILHS